MTNEKQRTIGQECSIEVSKIETLADFLQAALSLRARTEEALARYLIFLRTFEQTRKDIWGSAGCETFESFVQTHHLINVASYRNFCVATGMMTTEQLLAIGAEAAVEAASFRSPDPQKITAFVDRALSFRKMNGGVAPSGQTARQWVLQIDPREPRVVASANKMAMLEAELVDARQKIKVLERENAVLKKQLEKQEKRQSASS